MSFIENTYIDTVNNPDSTSYEGWFGLGGVVLGFGLTYVYEFHKNKKEINKVGKLFETITLDIQDKCEQQIGIIDYTLVELKKNNVIKLGVIFNVEVNPIDFIDKLKLFDYYYRLFKKKSKVINKSSIEFDIHKKLNSSFNEIGLLYVELKTLSDFSIKYFVEISNSLNDYITLFNGLLFKITDFQNRNRSTDFANDPFTKHINTIVSNQQSIGISKENISSLLETLHKQLLNIDSSFVTHPLYETIFKFNSDGKKAILLFNSNLKAYDNLLLDFKDAISKRCEKLELLKKAV